MLNTIKAAANVDNDNTLDYDENDLIDSPLSQILQEDNEQIEF